MKEKFIHIFIVYIVLSLFLIQTVVAFQTSNYDFIDTRHDTVIDTFFSAWEAAQMQWMAGYTTNSYLNAHVADARERMKNDNIFFYAGHGAPGALNFGNGEYITADWIYGDPNRLTKFTHGELDDLLFAEYAACDTGNVGPQCGDLLQVSHDLGVDTVLGFEGEILDTQNVYWNTNFWNYLRQGATIQTAKNSAISDTALAFGWANMGGMDHPRIVGDGDISITPARAGVLTLPTPSPTPTPSDPPSAIFSASQMHNPSQYIARFTDLSTNSPIQRVWSFSDDNSVSTSPNPVHQFPGPGTYQINLRVLNDIGSAWTTQNYVISDYSPRPSPTQPQSQALIADFTPSATEGVAPLTIHFTDTSTGSPSTYYWTFGDGSAPSTDKNPIYTYSTAQASPSQVTLTIQKDGVQSSKFIFIHAYGPNPNPIINTNVNTGTVPLTVHFTGLNGGNPGVLSWSFGDGGYSSEVNPTHIFNSTGNFTTTLTIVTATGNSATKTKQINVLSPHADFTADPTTRATGAPLTVRFNDTSTNSPNRWSWNFGDGDGTNATDQNPVHTYRSNGTYTVALAAMNPTGVNTVTKTNYITVGPLYALTNGARTVVIFNSTGSTIWTPPANVTKVEYLVVAGGGEGGNGGYSSPEYYPGGGGGAGGVLNGNGFTVVGPQTIIVGTGGRGTGATVAIGANGGSSSFGNSTMNKTAKGGGYGGGFGSAGNNGGSGGGGSGTGMAAGTGNATQGKDGGMGNHNLDGNPAGGGGGAAIAGSPASSTNGVVKGGNGGNGILIDITGTGIYYSGGGGGGVSNSATAGTGGSGCGADGSGGSGINAICPGGGGGGAGGGPSNGNGQPHGAGGNGTVILSYLTPPVAGFAAVPARGAAALQTVQFADISTGIPTSWRWFFGDGSMSTLQNPSHQYAANGSYTVNLTVTNAGGSNTTTRARYICVGDCRDKIGVFRSGSGGLSSWYLDRSGNGAWSAAEDTTFGFGKPGDIPVTGDWNGNGKTEIGVYNATGWFLDRSGNGVWSAAEDTMYGPGLNGDNPVTGDWNGDGKTEMGVFRNGHDWFLDSTGTGVLGLNPTYGFGMAGDIPLTGDWNGDGKTEIGVFRNGHGWFLDSSGNGAWSAAEDTAYGFGLAGDLPVTGDWNGDGKTEIGVFRNGNGWYLDSSGNGAWSTAEDTSYGFGLAGDKPVTGMW